MPPPNISYGLNLPNKKPAGPPGAQKRKKTIFDSDSDEDPTPDQDGGAIEISTIGGLEEAASAPSKPAQSGLKIKPKSTTSSVPPPKRKVPFNGASSSKPNAKPLSKKSIFASDDEEEEENGQEAGTTSEQLSSGLGAGASYGLNTGGAQPQKDKKAYTNLSALHSSRKHAQEASSLDPSIYSYDAVYESLHAKPEKAKAAEQDANDGVPRYMTNLLRSAEIRKRDQLRARDRMLAKEREAEGDEFADKEKFVTSAYKAQQEELRRVEEEEAERERQEEERRRQNGGSGMIGFYRDVLSRGEERHEAAVKAAEEAARKVQAGEAPAEAEEESSKEKTEAQKAAELNEKGARIAVNEEGQVVDKRQLLSAGLNVAPKPKTQGEKGDPKTARQAARPRFDAGNQSGGRAGQRARQTEMIASQLEEQARQQEEAEAARQKEIAERSRSQKTKTDVSSAKERYLARKREREAAAKGGA